MIKPPYPQSGLGIPMNWLIVLMFSIRKTYNHPNYKTAKSSNNKQYQKTEDKPFGRALVRGN
jgi:hypothetical protein